MKLLEWWMCDKHCGKLGFHLCLAGKVQRGGTGYTGTAAGLCCCTGVQLQWLDGLHSNQDTGQHGAAQGEGRQGWQGRWGALTSAPRQGKISAPRPAPPSAPGLAWASPSPVDPLTYFAQGWPEDRASMLKNCVPALRAALVQYRVLPCAHTRAALVRIRPLLLHAMRHATTSCQIMNDAVLVCICKMSTRA